MSRTADPYRVEELDWGRPETLVRFALLSRIDNVCASMDWNRSTVAARLRITPAGLHEKLTPQGLLRGTAPEFVRDLQRFLQVAEAQFGASGGELFSFYESVLNRWTDTETVRVPSTFFLPLLGTGDSNNEEEVLVRAAALAGIRRQAFSFDEADRLRQTYAGAKDPVDDTLNELVTLIGLSHPQRTLAVDLAAEMEDWVLPTIEEHLHRSPVGWKAPQILTRMLRLYEDHTETDRTKYLFHRIGEVLERIAQASLTYPDPGRVFIEEAMRRTPGRRRPTGDKRFKGPYTSWNWPWVPKYLKDVALDPSRPFRQRSYAAVCLLRRDETFGDAGEVVRTFRSEAANDPTEGLGYAADVLEGMLGDRDGWDVSKLLDENRHMLDRGVLAFSRTDAYKRIGSHFNLKLKDPNRLSAGPLRHLKALPATVRVASQALVLEAVLSIDATRRRTACDTLIAAGAADETALLLAEVLHSTDLPLFMRETASVVLGYLGDSHAIPALVELSSPRLPPDLRLTSLLALGEVQGADDHPELASERLSALVEATSQRNPSNIRHAATLSLATTMETSTAAQRAFHLEQISTSRHLAAATRELARWGAQRLVSSTFVSAVETTPHRTTSAPARR